MNIPNAFVSAKTKNAVAFTIGLSMLIASSAARLLEPKAVVQTLISPLATSIPTHFGVWTAEQDGLALVSLFAVDEDGKNPMNEVYDDSILRTYSGPAHTRMMLAIAYDRVQREEDRVHRPEICYLAQGFKILSDEAVNLSLDASGLGTVEGRQMLTKNGARLEAVTYWIRLGETFAQNPWVSRIYVVREGLLGRLQDGVLVRTSEIIGTVDEAPASYVRQTAFLEALLKSVSASTTTQLVGTPSTAHPT